MSHVLVVVYSLSGTSRRVAELLCSQQGWRLGVISDMQPRRGAWGNARCVVDSFLRRRPKILYDGPPPIGFDAVVLVSPIWAQRLAGPMRSFVAERRTALPDVAVVSVMGGRGAPHAVAEIAQLIGRAPVLATAVTMREVDEGSHSARLQAFGTAVDQARADAPALRPVTLSPRNA